MSDIARVYQAGKEPMLIAGTAASNTAGAGTPEQSGHEKATVDIINKSHVTDISR